MTKQIQLSPKTIAVMELIAGGQSYEQIVRTDPAITHSDIFGAAQEVITRVVEAKSWIDEIRERYPRAFMKWTPEEDVRLKELLRKGEFLSQIAKALERSRAGIRSHVIKLDFVDLLAPADRADLEQYRGRYRETRSGAVPQQEKTDEPLGNDANTSDREGAGAARPAVEQSSMTAAQRMGHPLART